MKRAILGADGVTVDDVIIIDQPFDGMPDGIDLPDDAYVGPGMVWNGDSKKPEFSAPKE